MKEVNRVIIDTPEICLEIIAGQALCRQCTVSPNSSSIAEADFPSFSTSNPLEFVQHIQKHKELKKSLNPQFTTEEYWEDALSIPQEATAPSLTT